MAGFRLTTKVQVSGWRFLLRRVEHAIVRRDTRMFDDPLQFYSRAVSAGIIVAVLICLGAVLLAYFKPLGKRGGDTLLVDRTTNQLYLMLPDSTQLRPAYNLTSARLITGRPDNPSMVKSSALDEFPRGNMLGIPGAPERMVANTTRDAYWTVCDAATGSVTGVTVIAGAPVDGGERATVLPAGEAILAENDGRTWLLWNGKRSAVDLADRAVTGGVGIGVDAAAPQPIAATPWLGHGSAAPRRRGQRPILWSWAGAWQASRPPRLPPSGACAWC